VYSLGAVLYTMLAGHHWTLDSDVGRSVKADPEVPADLSKILLNAVDEDPDRRFASMAELRAALRGYLEANWPGRSW
jgi:hypothetical protein